MENKKILVLYYNIDNYDDSFHERIGEFSEKNMLHIIAIPTLSETRLECINPQYITKKELIEKHNQLVSELTEDLNNTIKKLKENGK